MAYPTQAANLASASSQYYTWADSASMSPTGAFTFEIWIKWVTAPSLTNNIQVLCKDDGAPNRSYECGFNGFSSQRHMEMLISTDGSNANTNQVRVNIGSQPTGTWIHYAWVYTTAGGGTLEAFIDNVSQGTATGAGASVFDSTALGKLGARKNGGGAASNFVDGELQLGRFWKEARTATQLANNQCTELGSTTNLSAEWTLDNTTADNSGNSNTLTAVNTPTYTTDGPATCNIPNPFPSDSTAVSDTPTIEIVSFPSVTDSTAVSDLPTIRIGPIFFDATSSSPYEASLTTYNWQHTVGQGSSGILVIGVALLAAGTVSSITAGTKNAVFLRADSNGAYRSELWYVVNPDVGAQTITVNLSTSLTSIAGAISYFGVDQANPFEGTTGANGIGGSDTVNVITTDDLDTIVDVTSTLTNPISVGSGQVQRVNTAGALGSIGMADRQWVTPPGTKTANWTGTGALEHWAITATALVPAVDIQNISVSDSSAVSDSPIVEIIDLISVTDSTVVSDTPIIFIPILTIQVSDTTAVSDTPAIETIDQGINVTDSTVVSDTPTVEIISYVNATDSTAVSDIPTLEIISSINVSDSTAVSDTPTIEIISFINVTDSTAVLDTPILESILYINVTDTTTVSDVPAVSVVTLISVADSISVSDVPVVEIVSFINVTDSTVVSDTPVIFIPVLTIQVSDSTAVSDVPQFEEFSEISVTDTIVVTDSVVMIITLTVNVSDTVTVTDTPQIVERMSISAFNGIVRLGWKFGPYTMTL